MEGVAAAWPPGRAVNVSELLNMLEDGARGEGVLRILPDEQQAVPLSVLWQQSERAGRWLTGQVGKQGAVGAILVSSSSCIATLLGAWRSGLTVASLPYPARFETPEKTAQEYRRQVEELCGLVGAEIVLADPAYLQFLQDLRIRAVGFDAWQGRNVQAAGGDEEGSFVQFTSGTTSSPKGVRLSLDRIAAHLQSLLKVVEPQRGDVVCSWLPLSHDMGLIGLFLTPWVSGSPEHAGKGEICLIRTEAFRRQPSMWLDACSTYRATITAAPNYGFELAMHHLGCGDAVDLRSVRLCMTGGELLRGETLRRFAAMTGPLGFDARALSPAYGMAEATLAITMVRPTQHWRSIQVRPETLELGAAIGIDESEGIEVVSTGRAVPGMQIRVEGDGRATVGHVDVAGPSLFDGYVGREGSFTKDGWFRTGDLGFVHEGELFPIGRTDDMLSVMGHIHSAGGMEAAAAEHPAIHRGTCAVVAGEDGAVLIAERGRETERDALPEAAGWIRSQVADRCGAEITGVIFVAPGTLLRTPSGKLQRHRIKMDYEAGTLAEEQSTKFGAQQ
jgi:acyl-CoA synthetase (AMP-forming)/AMP-acid ligase II